MVFLLSLFFLYFASSAAQPLNGSVAPSGPTAKLAAWPLNDSAAPPLKLVWQFIESGYAAQWSRCKSKRLSRSMILLYLAAPPLNDSVAYQRRRRSTWFCILLISLANMWGSGSAAQLGFAFRSLFCGRCHLLLEARGVRPKEC